MSVVPDQGVYYGDYLQLGKLLDAQHPASDAAGRPAHDEMLFIIVHQAFELWFKQILHELDAAMLLMSKDPMAERDVQRVVAHLERIRAIQPLLLTQIDILETMTPLDFLDFRDLLVPASGGQSKQFRLIENQLGLDAGKRLLINNARYSEVLQGEDREAVDASEEATTFFDLLEAWLERNPFLEFGAFDFWAAYREAVDALLASDLETVRANPHLDEEAMREQVASAASTSETFDTLFDAEKYAQLQRSGRRRLSHRSFLAALLISLYRDEPILNAPWRMLDLLIDIDMGFTSFRQRHAILAHRMLGTKMGTGGTAGHRYLSAAAQKHAVFTDLFELSTFQIPRSTLPPLPDEVRQQMQFRWSAR